MTSGMHVLSAQVAGRLRRRLGHVPCCRKCGRPLKVNSEYYSRQTRTRVYYHLACWERAALDDKD